jgi:hypothetical protein
MSKDREFFTEDTAKQYSNYSRYIDQQFRSQASTFLLYIQTLSEICRDSFLISSVTESCLDVVRALCSYLDLVNTKYAKLLAGKTSQDEDDSEAEEEITKSDAFAVTIEELTRKLCWLIGSLAHNLVVVKPDAINTDQ